LFSDRAGFVAGSIGTEMDCIQQVHVRSMAAVSNSLGLLAIASKPYCTGFDRLLRTEESLECIAMCGSPGGCLVVGSCESVLSDVRSEKEFSQTATPGCSHMQFPTCNAGMEVELARLMQPAPLSSRSISRLERKER
jgi:hypothetical protein